MPAPKRPSPCDAVEGRGEADAEADGCRPYESTSVVLKPEAVDENGEADGEDVGAMDVGEMLEDGTNPTVRSPQIEEHDGHADGDDENRSSETDGEKDEFVLVQLSDIRKEVQCPICLGIIRKTRTVMECLHRFCRDCIDKSMRLGNNECPACRTHCASRRSLRDDENYDALIAALYPDIDKYEKEELSFREEERSRNKKIQESIAETIRRQSEALGKRKTKGRSRGRVRTRGRGRPPAHDNFAAGSDDDDDYEEAVGNDGSKESSSADDHSPEVRPKRGRRWSAPWYSPARAAVSSDTRGDENDGSAVVKESFNSSPLRAGNREMPIWGKNGTRSQIRHGMSSAANVRMAKLARVNKFAAHLRNLSESDHEMDIHVMILPLDAQCAPSAEKLFLCCRPSQTVGHLCQLIALNLSKRTEQVDIFLTKQQHLRSTEDTGKSEAPPEGMEKVGSEKLLCDLYSPAAFGQVYLELRYAFKRAELESSEAAVVVTDE